ncbi:hypothetical protein SPHI_14990 [Sphingomonas jeddahensis]|uniref:Uncharacterized protein n=2 Tax=Sphingomonas jeddahensis TaxID=1915074 RepID=A0A1V2EUK0_9SPHN|nr:hypothetical protein SPHI_14990 [Sphingomonas jeddahensis]
MDRIAFFRLRQRWKRSRSLRSVVPFMGRAPRKVGHGRQEEAGMALELLKAEGGVVTAPHLADRLVAEASAPMSRQTATRLLREASARLSAGYEELATTLGREALVDFSGTAMRILPEDGGGMLAVCLGVETASRVIVGWAAGPIVRSEAMLLETWRGFEEGFGNVGKSERAFGRLKVILPDVLAAFGAVAFSAVPGGVVDALSDGERRFGRGLVGLLGHRVGRVSLHPRAYSRGEPPIHGSGARTLRIIDAAALMGEAVRDHNLERRVALIDAVSKVDPALAGQLSLQTEGLDHITAVRTVLSAVPSWRDGCDRIAAAAAQAGRCADILAARMSVRIPLQP